MSLHTRHHPSQEGPRLSIESYGDLAAPIFKKTQFLRTERITVTPWQIMADLMYRNGNQQCQFVIKQIQVQNCENTFGCSLNSEPCPMSQINHNKSYESKSICPLFWHLLNYEGLQNHYWSPQDVICIDVDIPSRNFIRWCPLSCELVYNPYNYRYL